jgi:hypothetical protein
MIVVVSGMTLGAFFLDFLGEWIAECERWICQVGNTGRLAR